MKKASITDLFIQIIIAELTGVLSSLLTGSFGNFFEKYQSPPLQPPAIVFPVVWTILYALMGISAYLIISSDSPSQQKNSALRVYYAQLILNFLWSIVFFRFERLILGAVIIAAMIILVAIMIYRFYKIRPAAGYINIPYLIWLCFALYLNIATIAIN